jgi:hypothetical protein
MTESDGMDEAVEGATRMVLTMAGRSLEDVARHLERLWRERQAEAEKAAREAELRRAAEAELGPGEANHAPVLEAPPAEAGPRGGEVVHVDLGQEPLTAQKIMERSLWAKEYDSRLFHAMGDAYGRGDEAGTRRAFENITQAWSAAPEEQRQWARDTVTAAMNDRAGSQAEADAERRRGRDELGHSSRLLIEADQADRAGDPEHADVARDDADRLYDSAERREAMADELEAEGAEPDVIEARVLSDTAQARPGRDAVASGKPAKAPKARKGRGVAGRTMPQQKVIGR